MVRTSSKEAPVTMTSIEKYVNENKIADKVEYGMKKGKKIISFMLREAEKTEEKDSVEVDVSDYTNDKLNKLIEKYQNYITFGV